MEYTNSLINETSPYLLQHAHNPVNWMPWSDSVFELARSEDKLVLLSIGYSACHWCHVMEHESFEDPAVAEIMNKNFINVKIDREERPDVDMLYMTAVQIMNGQGGWPLNCFILPDGRPIYGGTYFPKQHWVNVLLNLSQLYATDRDKVYDYADQLTEGIRQAELITTEQKEDKEFKLSVLEKSVSKWKARFDNNEGGANRAPKFPLPNNYSFLLKYANFTNDQDLLNHVDLTLKKMACGGIYDQLEGGFARYSTDMYWKVPHFEKMLYDNGQLVGLYCEAYRHSKNELYKEIVLQTLDFVEKNWISEEGGFYSALDADSEGEEGKYYVWQEEELRDHLGEDYDLFSAYYNVNECGYWENDNYILVRTESPHVIRSEYDLKQKELEKKIADCRSVLLEARKKRIAPGLDDKILAAWNGMMCKAYCEAYLTFKDKNYKAIAIQNAEFLKNKLISSEFCVWRSYKGKARINGFLDDYSFIIDAFISVYTISQDESWLHLAENLTEYTLQNFFNSESGLFYYTDSKSGDLIIRTTETNDNVTPSSNSQMAINLFRLSKILAKSKYDEISRGMVNRFTDEMINYGAGYSNWAILYLDLISDFFEVCIVGKDVEEKLLDFHNYYIPNAIFAVATSHSGLELLKERFSEGKTLIYVCKNQSCLLPTTEVKEALQQLEITV